MKINIIKITILILISFAPYAYAQESWYEACESSADAVDIPLDVPSVSREIPSGSEDFKEVMGYTDRHWQELALNSDTGVKQDLDLKGEMSVGQDVVNTHPGGDPLKESTISISRPAYENQPPPDDTK